MWCLCCQLMKFTTGPEDSLENDTEIQLKSGFAQQSSVTSSLAPASARPPVAQYPNMNLYTMPLSPPFESGSRLSVDRRKSNAFFSSLSKSVGVVPSPRRRRGGRVLNGPPRSSKVASGATHFPSPPPSLCELYFVFDQSARSVGGCALALKKSEDLRSDTR